MGIRRWHRIDETTRAMVVPGGILIKIVDETMTTTFVPCDLHQIKWFVRGFAAYDWDEVLGDD